MEEKKKVSATFSCLREARNSNRPNVPARSGRHKRPVSRNDRPHCVTRAHQAWRQLGAALVISATPSQHSTKFVAGPQPEQNRNGTRSRSEKQGRARGLGCAREISHLLMRRRHSPDLIVRDAGEVDDLGRVDAARNLRRHQTPSTPVNRPLQRQHRLPRHIQRRLPPAESGPALLRNGGRGSFALGYRKM